MPTDGQAAMDSLKNIFAIPELRKRVLFTFGLLAAYRVGRHITTPGINIDGAAELTRQAAASNLFGLYDMFSGLQPVADDGVRARRHALHQRVDHPAVADGRLAVPRAALEGRRAGPPQDYAVHALRHDCAEHRAGARRSRSSWRTPTQSRAGFRLSTIPAGASG